MQTEALKPARMELKTTKDAKELLGQAALLDGMDLTSFVLGPAIERARKVIADHALISLSKKGQLALANVLNNPAKPSREMKDLMSLPDFPSKDAR